MVMSRLPRFFGPPCIYRPGVRPSVFPVYRPLQQLAAGLLLGAPRANLLKRNIVIKEICSWLPPFCKENLLLFIQPKWQLRKTYFNHCLSVSWSRPYISPAKRRNWVRCCFLFVIEEDLFRTMNLLRISVITCAVLSFFLRFSSPSCQVHPSMHLTACQQHSHGVPTQSAVFLLFACQRALRFCSPLLLAFFPPFWWHWTESWPSKFHSVHSQHPLLSPSSSFCCTVWSDRHPQPWPSLSHWNLDQTHYHRCWTSELYSSTLLTD